MIRSNIIKTRAERQIRLSLGGDIQRKGVEKFETINKDTLPPSPTLSLFLSLLPFPIALVINAGKSLSEKSLAKRSSTDDIEEERRRQGEEGGVEEALSSLLPPPSSRSGTTELC